MPRPVKGSRIPGSGRKKGVPNKTTTAAREAFNLAFAGLGGVKRLQAWAEANETEFYKLYARLIPIDHTSGGKEMAALTAWKFGDREVAF